MEGYTGNSTIIDSDINQHSAFVNDTNHDFFAMQWSLNVKMTVIFIMPGNT